MTNNNGKPSNRYPGSENRSANNPRTEKEKEQDREPDQVTEQETGLEADQVLAELKKLEEWFPVATPGFPWFEHLVVQHKRELRRKLIRDLILFWLLALAILGVILTVVIENPVLYIAIQAGVLLAASLTLMGLRRKRVSRS